MPSFFEELLDFFPSLPSLTNPGMYSHTGILAAYQNEPVTFTPYALSLKNRMQTPTATEPNKSFSTHPKLVKDRLLEAKEQGNTFGTKMTACIPLNKYTEATFPLIHYMHPTTIFDHLNVNQVEEWENLPKGKILAQPFGPDARNIGKHPYLKTLLFAAIVEITNS
jgi:hypothetical protein